MKAVRIFLLQHDLTFHSAAALLGISTSYLHETLSGKKKALNIRRRLVEELHFPAYLVAWPSKSVKGGRRA